MFICSVKASTLRFVGVILFSAMLLAGLGIFAGSMAATKTAAAEAVCYTGIKTDADRRGFLSSLGLTPGSEKESVAEFTLPGALDAVLLGYNEIQKEQGLDLSPYTGKKVTRYTYRIENYEGHEGPVYANIIQYRDRVIAADLTASGEGGFVRPLR